ncbi:MAG: helix-turn-helix transcriptional regulator, partial [Oscillospiraceae bacterium]|nr:helix-turn-helix transcriptional regulator [Oscillospiraceae bacterium]
MKEKPVMAQRIKELRKAKGLTQAQLANETNLKETAIRSYENGLREPNSKAMVALERYFKVSGEYLRGEVDRETFLQNSAV